MKTILDQHKFRVVIERLAHQLIENHGGFENAVIIGIQPRGVFLADRIVSTIEKFQKISVPYGKLDITFYRDDFNTGKELHIPNATSIPFSIEDKKVILIDDVLFTGRTIRSALDALTDFGRPQKVELMTLIDRRYSRQLPIQADYVGMTIDAMITQKVKVFWKNEEQEDQVVLLNSEPKPTQKK
ncbi:MAG: bifunctional pyr operon transcriptional regulator/uracil phosphoribosyltransferase PyrR [Chitinophagaceae bacterium]|nr:bifunctional pyr operon transcriptional regulator/uracil phosphoribosyltransferase PyrR [Chitinophagaceae bacterium]